MNNVVIFTKEQQAEVLLDIARSYGKYSDDNFHLWGNLKTKEVLYSENEDEYAEYVNQPCMYVHLTDVFDYTENVYYVVDTGIEGIIENNFLQDIKIQLSFTDDTQETILNYTPHTVNIIDTEGNKLQDFPPTGEARCQQSTVVAGTIGDIPITSTSFGFVVGLPNEQEGTYYIVSRLIRQVLPNRADLLVPNEIIRDDVGRVIGCKSLAIN